MWILSNQKGCTNWHGNLITQEETETLRREAMLNAPLGTVRSRLETHLPHPSTGLLHGNPGISGEVWEIWKSQQPLWEKRTCAFLKDWLVASQPIPPNWMNGRFAKIVDFRWANEVSSAHPLVNLANGQMASFGLSIIHRPPCLSLENLRKLKKSWATNTSYQYIAWMDCFRTTKTSIKHPETCVIDCNCLNLQLVPTPFDGRILIGEMMVLNRWIYK